ncbi:MAG: hypothetical protein ACI9ZH_001131 [Paracoccaceae bacterium]|jgi:hypothetical protein
MSGNRVGHAATSLSHAFSMRSGLEPLERAMNTRCVAWQVFCSIPTKWLHEPLEKIMQTIDVLNVKCGFKHKWTFLRINFLAWQAVCARE